ncbi:hypothetical protein SISNIDRAFT_225795 [Sistotremastrum niveocremeum HHB9708]|uniref:Secreted peptide n=1 Tax=Sistotremastrum niveocremeum HHB9708 TaxID=1314777 RepID=A0A164QA90_9AGAM|nr:hypothetical protein SISNIDRAFT_225795 [Sistotremastrum niveocremeum HHB9708]
MRILHLNGLLLLLLLCLLLRQRRLLGRGLRRLHPDADIHTHHRYEHPLLLLLMLLGMLRVLRVLHMSVHMRIRMRLRMRERERISVSSVSLLNAHLTLRRRRRRRRELMHNRREGLSLIYTMLLMLLISMIVIRTRHPSRSSRSSCPGSWGSGVSVPLTLRRGLLRLRLRRCSGGRM